MVYWTSSAYVGYAFVSWYVHFDDGNTNADYRDGNHGYDAFLVRLVR
jgi:hypothetical protein